MKRILSLILIFLLVFTLASCDELYKKANKTNAQKTTQSDTKKPSQPDERKVLNQMYGHALEDSKLVFSEDVLSHVTDVVEAEYKGRHTKYYKHGKREDSNVLNYNYLYEFDVTYKLRGNNIDKTIYVFVDPCEYSITGSNYFDGLGYSTYETSYKEGQCYLLLLKRTKNEFFKDDMFEFAEESLYLPIREDGILNLEEATMYGDRLDESIYEEDIKKAISNGSFLDKILEAVNDNPLIKDKRHLQTDNGIEAVLQSPYVYEVEILSIQEKSYYYGTARCKVISKLKGDFGETEKTIDINLPISEVSVGKRYIIAFFENYKRANLSSNNSIFANHEKEDVMLVLRLQSEFDF